MKSVIVVTTPAIPFQILKEMEKMDRIQMAYWLGSVDVNAMHTVLCVSMYVYVYKLDL